MPTDEVHANEEEKRNCEMESERCDRTRLQWKYILLGHVEQSAPLVITGENTN